jgi:glycosyltransferase involved in cell wall biosynthesis
MKPTSPAPLSDLLPSRNSSAPADRPLAVLLGTLERAPVRSLERYSNTLATLLPGFGWDTRLVRGPSLPLPAKGRIASYISRELSPQMLYPARARRERGDVYHIIADAYGYLLTALPPERTLVTCHDLAPWQVPAIYSRWFGRTFGLPLWERGVKLMTRAAHIACVSEFTRREVIERLNVPEENTSVVPNGVSDAFVAYEPERRAEVRRRLGFSEDELLVLHVGIADYTKNPETAMRATGLLRERGLPARFLKVGPISEEQHALLREVALGEHYRQLSAPSDGDLCDVYNACDVLLFPSRNEGFGWPPVEAMRAGLPVVVSTTPALTEVTGGLAPAFDPEDAGSFADAAAAVWARRDHRDEDMRPSRRHAETFTWERSVGMIAALYDRLRG